ncbi:hypothetical protein ABK046_47200, partial [Streptomyces caeruleatus]
VAEKEVQREIKHIVKQSKQKRAGLAEKNKTLKLQKETLLTDLEKARDILLEQAGHNPDKVNDVIKENRILAENYLPNDISKETEQKLK